MFGEKYAGQNSEIYPGFHKVIPGKKRVKCRCSDQHPAKFSKLLCARAILSFELGFFIGDVIR